MSGTRQTALELLACQENIMSAAVDFRREVELAMRDEVVVFVALTSLLERIRTFLTDQPSA